MEETKKLVLLECIFKISKLRINSCPTKKMNYSEISLCSVLLMHENKEKGVQIKEICNILESSPQAMSRLIRSCLKKGLVEKYIYEDNKKAVFIKLSQKAKKELLEERKKVSDFFQKITTELGEEETQEVCKKILKLHDAIKKISEGEKEC